jgi:hypothetical protein
MLTSNCFPMTLCELHLQSSSPTHVPFPLHILGSLLCNPKHAAGGLVVVGETVVGQSVYVVVGTAVVLVETIVDVIPSDTVLSVCVGTNVVVGAVVVELVGSAVVGVFVVVVGTAVLVSCGVGVTVVTGALVVTVASAISTCIIVLENTTFSFFSGGTTNWVTSTGDKTLLR